MYVQQVQVTVTGVPFTVYTYTLINPKFPNPSQS